jgi:hypothetical protein
MPGLARERVLVAGAEPALAPDGVVVFRFPPGGGTEARRWADP